MQKLSELTHFQEQQNIVLQGYDPISAGGFTQVPNAILKDPKISTNAKVVYAMLLSYAWHNNKVFPGQERMAEDIGMSRPSVTKAIGELVKAEYLEVTRRGQGRTNVYILKAVVKTN
jgi:hypothetical protein